MKMIEKGFWKGMVFATVLFCLGAATPLVWGPSISGALYYIGSENPAQLSMPSSDTLKLVLDPADEDTGYKSFEIYSGDHATYPWFRVRNDGDTVEIVLMQDDGTTVFQGGSPGP